MSLPFLFGREILSCTWQTSKSKMIPLSLSEHQLYLSKLNHPLHQLFISSYLPCLSWVTSIHHSIFLSPAPALACRWENTASMSWLSSYEILPCRGWGCCGLSKYGSMTQELHRLQCSQV